MTKTLLLADDSVTIQKVVNISFASEDVTLVTVDNGDDAVLRAAETRPDLILADVVMPGKNGYEVCEAIKANPDLAHIPVLLLTGTFEAFDEERANQVGAAGHVAKPFEAQSLVAKVKQLLATSPPSEPALETPADPAPIARPEAVTAPEAGNSDSFDFFDDDLGDVPLAAASSAPDDVASFDDSDSAFAFGEDEFSVSPASGPDVASVLAEPAPDHTVAILPGDSDLEDPVHDDGPADILAAPLDMPLADPPRDTSVADLASEFGDLSEIDAEASLSPIDPFEPADDSFDFANPVTPAAEVDGLVSEPDDGLMSIENEDLVQATVLDPNGASGFDVSSSDLGDPLALGREAAIDPIPEIDEWAPLTPAPAEPIAVAEPADMDSELAEALLEPAAQADDLAPAPEEAAVAELLPPPIPATPMTETAPAAPSEDRLTADAVLEEIAPALREQIHDTLEKIAWESFGDVTEKIISQTVERVEKIAWEVIPQLAETLIKEEIRRMKGDLED